MFVDNNNNIIIIILRFSGLNLGLQKRGNEGLLR